MISWYDKAQGDKSWSISEHAKWGKKKKAYQALALIYYTGVLYVSLTQGEVIWEEEA